MKSKISIIGAGSGAFSLSLIRDICLTPTLAGSTISFMDIDPERLEAAYTVCQRYTHELGVDLHLEKTLDRRVSLEGAEFVVNTALAAGHHRLREGWEIARKYGYSFGGSFHVMYDEAFWINFYQLQLFESVIEDGQDLCPDAYHLLVANPVLAGITYLSRKYPEANVVGLCHGFGGVYHIANVLGLDHEGLTFEIPGVNHFVWLTRCYHKGQDVFPLLDDWIETEMPKYHQNGEAPPIRPKIIDLYKRFGAVPIGDTAGWSGASWPWWYHSDEQTEKKWHEKPQAGWDRYFSAVARNAEAFKQVAHDSSIKATEHFPPRISGEPMIPIIDAIANDTPRIIIGNIHNYGDFVPGIPSDFEVEIPMLFSKRGIQGIRTKGLPQPLLTHILRERVVPVNLELEAYTEGSKDLLLQLILLDPWSRSEQQASDFLEEILSLPYHEEMRQHYH